ncbi:DUF1343 domain-containing protein [candidate division KSB1 bacterium]|nr:DUF1343 domain-containing protein [candidate division KSB1 bacterium]
MINFKNFLSLKDDNLIDGRIGLLCNQVSFDPETRKYLFQLLAERSNLKRIFLPEHGMFAELQDMIPLDSTHLYDYLKLDTEIISLYGESESTLTVQPEHLADLDALVIDIQDVGSRYYTFATTVSYIFDVLAKSDHRLEIYILDRLNPCGRQVEGTILTEEYSSFVGRPGLPHKHGLTIGELCRFYESQLGADLHLHIIPLFSDFIDRVRQFSPVTTWSIPPSPNMPGPVTPLVYTGQCLLEGTNVSEGRGTTRPFEIFGAPFMDWIFERSDYPKQPGAFLRPLRFIPTFQKHAGKICSGFQLHLTGEPYHSLAHSLKIIRYLKENSGEAFQWRREVYEFRDDRLAIELLAGSKILLDYLNGRYDFPIVQQAFDEDEEKWIDQIESHLIYPEKLYRVTQS